MTQNLERDDPARVDTPEGSITPERIAQMIESLANSYAVEIECVLSGSKPFVLIAGKPLDGPTLFALMVDAEGAAMYPVMAGNAKVRREVIDRLATALATQTIECAQMVTDSIEEWFL